MTTRIKQRRDTAANWLDYNPILALGETGWETDTGRVKIGDGSSNWQTLQYAVGGAGHGLGGAIQIGTVCTSGSYCGCCNNSVAIGTGAGSCCRCSGPSIAIGHDAGHCKQHGSAIAIGRQAGRCCQAMNTIAMGRYAGSYGQHYGAVAIGKYAGNYGQQSYGVAIGYGAQNGYGGCNAVAIGHYAGSYGQNTSAVAIGHQAGACCQGYRSVSIGRWAGQCCQCYQSVAIGALAGREYQGECSVAIGRHAGLVNQGCNSVAIGHQAGQGLGDSQYYCHINATYVSGGASGATTFVVDTVAGIHPGMYPEGANLGPQKVTAVNTSTNEITLDFGTFGQLSGTYYFYGAQGSNAVAIGAYAGLSVQQDNSIIINATGVEVNSAGTGTTVIKPIAPTTTGNPLYYNADTGQITYGTVNRYVSTATSTPVNAPVIDITSSKVFLAPLASGNASYVLQGDGLYDGQTIEFYPQWKTGTNNADVAGIYIYVSKIFDPGSSNGRYSDSGYYNWYPFQNFNTGNAKGTATWDANQQHWVINPGWSLFD